MSMFLLKIAFYFIFKRGLKNSHGKKTPFRRTDSKKQNPEVGYLKQGAYLAI